MALQAALKEWASAIRALRSGDTIVALRKGGIREETRDFQLTSESFLFFPTYEHQKEHLLKEEYRYYAPETKEAWEASGGQVTVEAWAEAVEDVLIEDEDKLRGLLPYHIWTETFAEERLHWKRTKPLHCLLLRVYELEKPIVIERPEQFSGCKSWIELPVDTTLHRSRPVLSDEKFAEKVHLVKNILR